MEVMIKQENRAEVNEVMNFLDGLNTNEKKEFMAFIAGAKFTRIWSQDQNAAELVDVPSEPPQKTA